SSRLCLRPGAEATYQRPDEETIVVLQQGRGRLATPDQSWTVSRESVFSERATALCIPPGVRLSVHAESDLEAILISAPAEAGGAVGFIGPGDVTVNERGRGSYARQVH